MAGKKNVESTAFVEKKKAKKLTTAGQVLDELIKLAKGQGCAGALISCDMLDQEELFAMQEKLMDIMESIDREKCIKAFPWMYKEVKRT